jgi:hypothetical protein
MTYAVGGLIQASDYNNFLTTVNSVWSTGSGNAGYGQTALPTVTAGNIIYASEVSALLNTVADAASHQGTTLGSYIDGTPSPGEIVRFEPNLQNNVTLINTNRLNAVAQGSTSASTITNSSITWVNSLLMTWSVAFSSHNAARYFFNSGGQFALTASHPGSGAPINAAMSALASNLGTIVLSSPTGADTATIVGVSYNGVKKVGGGAASYILNSGTGFYALTGSNQLLIRQFAPSGGMYYSASVIDINASYDGAGTLTITMLWDEIPDGMTVSTGSSGVLTVRYPASTYITNTWGTPTIITSVTGS